MLATTGTDTLLYQYNNHGDVVRVLDQSGTLKNEYDYDAFGNAITEKEIVKNPGRGLPKDQLNKILKQGPPNLSVSSIHEVNPQ